ncbi:unnamed protein product [Ectocarpus sp. CCAP 1310/34]|nr:unnamed protein product [Ectocarpus sp. CCAP 1310/34]
MEVVAIGKVVGIGNSDVFRATTIQEKGRGADGSGIPLLLPSTAQRATTVGRMSTAIAGTPTPPHPQHMKGQGLRAAIAGGLRIDTLLCSRGSPGVNYLSLSLT